MRFPLRASMCLALAAALAATAVPACARPEQPAPAGGAGLSGLPPLLDRELFFGDPQISGSQLSPDGKFISFIKPYRDARNIWVKRLEEPFDAARPVTADQRPVPGYFWSRDGKFILYVQDKGGNENWHVWAVDPAAPPEAGTGVPPARDLTPLENVAARINDLPENRPGVIIVGLNDRDAEYHDIYEVDIATGERKLLIQNTEKVGGYVFDWDGAVRLAVRPLPGGGNELLRVDSGALTRVLDWTYEEQAGPAGFTPDNRKVYLVTNKGADVDLMRLELFDPQTGERQVVESDPEKQVDFEGPIFDSATHELIGTSYVGDRVRIYPRDKQFKKDLEILRKKLPDGDLGWNSSTRDMRLHLVSVSSDVDPGSVYLYDRQTGKVELVYRGRPELPSEQLAPMKPVRYEARDGLEIPAYLTLPKGVPAKNLPTIIYPHGGPWARDYWGYDPYAQFLANRGYAVLQPNFRISVGYGKKFFNAGVKQWGTGAMQHDLTDGVRWLIAQGIADPKRVAIHGGSYGGYATLAGVTFTPELYACAVPYVAPSNIVTLIESFPAYWRPFLENSWFKRVGDPAKEEDRKDMLARSPLFFVDRIRVPLLVVHGANDPRVKQAESDRVVVALRDKGMPVEYIVAPDEGHGFRSPENRMALAVAMERFLAKHLGGRCQESVPEKIAARLAEITVDPATVKLPDAGAAEAAKAAATSPLPRTDASVIRPARMSFKGQYNVGGQSLPVGVNREIAVVEEGGRALWRVIDAVTMPMGAMADTFWVERATLLPVRRAAGGLGTTMTLRYGAGAITGKAGGGGQVQDVNVALEAPIYGDGCGFDLVLAGLPLAEGYREVFRQFETSSQKVRPFAVAVKGSETAVVGGKTYEAFVVEVAPLDDDPGGAGVMRVLKDAPHFVLDSDFKLGANMGGGSFAMTMESME